MIGLSICVCFSLHGGSLFYKVVFSSKELRLKMSLTSFKRRWIEKWCEEVHRHLLDGNMCNNVLSIPSCCEESQEQIIQGILKTALPLKGGLTKNPDQEKLDIGLTKTEPVKPEGPLPAVKFSYSHFQDQKTKIERLVHGLPILSNSATQLDRTTREDSGMPFIVVQGEEQVKSRREKEGSLDRGKVISAPASLTAQRLAHELKRQSQDVSSGGIRVNIMNSEQVNRIKTAPAFHKSNLSKARRLLAKRNQNARKFDGQPYSPIENCWTMTEVTWT